ncbi:MAG: hypothetical protein HRT87_07435 [Legionellales bacterium]|nr:hypothetical protein [Legionellales bacterium]
MGIQGDGVLYKFKQLFDFLIGLLVIIKYGYKVCMCSSKQSIVKLRQKFLVGAINYEARKQNRYREIVSNVWLLTKLFCIACSKYDFLEYKLKNFLLKLKIRKFCKDTGISNKCLLQDLQEVQYDKSKIKISFYGAIRVRQVRCLFSDFLESLIKKSSCLEQIEVITVIDQDDDMSYFYNLKKKFHNVNIHYIISDIRYGYKHLNGYYRLAIKNISEKSKVLGVFTSDVTITLNNFDKKIMAIDSNYSDNIYIIESYDERKDDLNLSRKKRASYLGDNISSEALLWQQQRFGPADCYPFISRKILDVSFQCLNMLPKKEREQWCPFANSTMIDCYIDTIANDLIHLDKIFLKRIHSLPFTKVNYELCALDYKNDLEGLISVSDISLIELGKQGAQDHLKRIAKNIYQHMLSSNIPG